VTDNAELVALGVSQVGAIVVGMVFGPHSWWPLGSTTVGERDCVGLVDDGSAAGKKSDHLTVSGFVELRVVGFPDEEQRSRVGMRLPTSPWTLQLAKPLLHSENGHQSAVEGERSVKVLDADEDVREHGPMPEISGVPTPNVQ